MKIRFLIDENLSPRLKQALLRLNLNIDVLRVGDDGAAEFGTLDPDILFYLESSERILVTDNRNSIPGHLEVHWSNGGMIWRILWVRPRTSIGDLASNLWLIWEVYETEEWIDKTDWIPF